MLSSYSKKILGHSDVIFASGVILIIAILLFPISAVLIDLLLSVSVSFSIVILITSLLIDRPLDFNSFPSILLVATMLRLALNIASTRLILLNGHLGTEAAGHIIESFGRFVMQGSVVIGIIVFIILTIINFIVITKGSGRIAEVSARFSLDAMPGKQMAIDAELSAGLINEEAARTRRRDLEAENTFFGAMDGASKFVRGDAIAGILITIVNFVAGVIIGVVQRGLTFNNALSTYTILTIGDGLISQIPALIISVAAGLLVTKSGALGSTEKAIFAQLAQHPKALGLTSFFLFFISLMPGIPVSPFMAMSLVVGAITYFLVKSRKSLAQSAEEALIPPAATEEEILTGMLKLDLIKIELGGNLLQLAVEGHRHNIVTHIKSMRRQIAQELGFIIPSIRLQDNLSLRPNQYAIKIKDVIYGAGDIVIDQYLVISPTGEEIDLPRGQRTKEPAFGLPAMWVDEHLREEALLKHYTTVESHLVIITHLSEVLKENIEVLVSYNEVQSLIDNLDESSKRMAQEAIPAQLSIPYLQKILQSLLKERVSIRDLPTIIESALAAPKNNVTAATEYIREALAPQIISELTTEGGSLIAIALGMSWEEKLTQNITADGQLTLPPSEVQSLLASLKSAIDANYQDQLVLMVSKSIRPYVVALMNKMETRVPVIAYNEVPFKTKVKVVSKV